MEDMSIEMLQSYASIYVIISWNKTTTVEEP